MLFGFSCAVGSGFSMYQFQPSPNTLLSAQTDSSARSSKTGSAADGSMCIVVLLVELG